MAINSTVVEDWKYDTQAWRDSKAAMEYCGIEVGNIEVGKYGELLRTLKPFIEAGKDVEGQITEYLNTIAELENTINENDIDFSNIYDAIVLIGGNPVKDNRDTYPSEIDKATKELGDRIDELENTVNEKNTTITGLENTVNEKNNIITGLEGTISENDDDFNNIYQAIVLVGGVPVKEDRDTYAEEISKLSTGGGTGGDVEFTNLAYFFYKNSRDITELWHLVNSRVTNMEHMLESATLPDNEYTIDICGISDASNLAYMIKDIQLDNNQIVTLKFIVGSMTRSLENMLSNELTQANTLIGDRGIKFEIADGGDCSNVLSLKNTFNGQKYMKIDLTKFNNSKLSDLNGAFSYIQAGELVLPIETSNVSDFTKCFSHLNNIGYLTMDKLDLSTWVFKRGAFLSYFLENAKNYGNIIFKEGTVLQNCKTDRMFFNNVGLLEVNNLVIKDDDSMTLTSAHDRTFEGCTNLVNINSIDSFDLKSNSTYMFTGCTSLKKIPPIIFEVKGSSRNSITAMFQNCSNLENIHIEVIHPASSNVGLSADYAFRYCGALKTISGNLDLSKATSISNMFNGCNVLEKIETAGSLGGLVTSSAQTFDLSSSPVFNIADFLNRLASNNSGKVKTIKLHSTVYNALTDDVKAIAGSKNYTLAG